MKKLMICMAFFGMLIGNGNAATDNATELSAALDTANVGEILDKLATLNTGNSPTDAKTEMENDNTKYNNLKSKLDNKDTKGAVHTIIKYDDHDRKYYLQNSDDFSNYVKAKLDTEIDTIKKLTGGTQVKYETIIATHGYTVYKQTDAGVWKGKITTNTCKSTDVGNIKNKIEQLYNNSMVKTVKDARQKILKELLKKKMVEKITSVKTFTEFVKTTDEMIKQYAKGKVEEIIDDKIKAPAVAAVNAALKNEVKDGLNAAMAECQTVYNNKKAELMAKEKQEISGSGKAMSSSELRHRRFQLKKRS